MAERLDLSRTQIAESLTVIIPTLRDKTADANNRYVSEKIDVIARTRGMEKSFQLLTHLLERTSNHLERTLVIKSLCPYFLNETGMAKFFRGDRRSFVYGTADPGQRWQGAIKDDYRICLKRLKLAV